MQILAAVLNMPIKIARSEQTCALGAGMFAAVAAGIYPNLQQAQSAMGQGFEDSFEPIAEHVALYDSLYAAYMKAGELVEKNEINA